MTREWSHRFEFAIWATFAMVAAPYILAYARYVTKWWRKTQARASQVRAQATKKGKETL